MYLLLNFPGIINKTGWEIKMKKMVSFVIPCYNSSKMLEKVVDEIKVTMEELAE